MRNEAKRFCFLALGGVLTGLTLVISDIGFLCWLTLIPMALVLQSSAKKESLRSLFGYGFFFFMCFYLVVYHWLLTLYPLDFIEGITSGEALLIVLAGWIGLSLLQSLGGGLLFVLFGAICRLRIAEKYPVVKPFFAAALWVILEWTQTLGWFGVPWGRLSIAMSKYPFLLQSASLFGSYFITFLVVSVNFILAYAILNADRRKLLSAIACGLVLLHVGACGVLWAVGAQNEGESVKIAAVQGNISTSEKWDKALVYRTFDIYRKNTVNAAEDGANIVLWPETALPLTFSEGSVAEEYALSVADEAGITVLVGAFTKDEDSKQYNSILAVAPDGKVGKTVYSKRHLVPFGEYLPMEDLVEFLLPPVAQLMRADALTAGKGTNIIVVDDIEVGALVCFDSIYERLALESVRDGATVLTVSTNDSWFMDSAALYMHNAQSQLRAIENGRYVVRAANTGVSSVISDRGEILLITEPYDETYIVGEVYQREGRTLYSYVGNLFVFLCAFVMVLCFLSEIYFGKVLTKSQKTDTMSL